ncbi:hypothetical protein [Calothrix sp. 336/3]|nr:hypothetical protein [Calothrix sp. 336/3]
MHQRCVGENLRHSLDADRNSTTGAVLDKNNPKDKIPVDIKYLSQ